MQLAAAGRAYAAHMPCTHYYRYRAHAMQTSCTRYAHAHKYTRLPSSAALRYAPRGDCFSRAKSFLSMSKTSRIWPARNAAQEADRPRLVGASGNRGALILLVKPPLGPNLVYDMKSFRCQLVKPTLGERDATQERRAAEERRVLRLPGLWRPLFVGRVLFVGRCSIRFQHGCYQFAQPRNNRGGG